MHMELLDELIDFVEIMCLSWNLPLNILMCLHVFDNFNVDVKVTYMVKSNAIFLC